jgi:hypothetical protein
MPFCRDCGKEVQDDWKLCPYCESPVNPSTPESAPQPTEVNVTDSVVMGSIENTTNITVIEEKNIHNHLLTMIDALREGRTKRATEIFEIAKKINHSLANDLRNGEYRLQVNEARLTALTNYWETKVKGKKPTWAEMMEDTFVYQNGGTKLFVENALEEAFSIIEEVPDMLGVYVVLGAIGAEYLNFGLNDYKGINVSDFAEKELRKMGWDGRRAADVIARSVEIEKKSLAALDLQTNVAMIVAGVIIILILIMIISD